jgi:hypothetical protein
MSHDDPVSPPSFSLPPDLIMADALPNTAECETLNFFVIG